LQVTEAPDLSLEFSADRKQAKLGEVVTFTLTIFNQGLLPATGVRVSNLLPEGFSYIEGGDRAFPSMRRPAN
jgi:uncharacterized repeat protein (TIGR01451 family)